MLSSDSVRPPPSSSSSAGGDGGQHLTLVEDEDVNMREAMLDDPIVGVEPATEASAATGAIHPGALPSPKPMTAAQKVVRDLSHLPHDPACPICASSRGLNVPHQISNEHLRVIPLLVDDYCFIRFVGHNMLQTVLVMRLHPYRLLVGGCVPAKGPHPQVVRRLIKFIRDAGLTHFAYRCDREPASGSLVDEACAHLGRTSFKVKTDDIDANPKPPVAAFQDDKPDAPTEVPMVQPGQGPIVAVPGLTHPSGSQPNGLAERSVGVLEDQVRVLLTALQSRMKIPLSTNQPVVAWLVEHAAYLLNKYQIGKDCKSAYCRLHGKESKERICEFGENILWFIPKRLRGKADRRFGYGVFLGRALGSDQNFVGRSGGTVVRARAIVRRIPSARWDAQRLLAISTTPLTEKCRYLDLLEQQERPHAHDPTDEIDDVAVPESSGPRGLKITPKYLRNHGFSEGCPRCSCHEQSNHRRARFHKHTEACRQRLYSQLRAAGSDKICLADDSRTASKHFPKEPNASDSPVETGPPDLPPPAAPPTPVVNEDDREASDLVGLDEDDFHNVVNEDGDILENASRLEHHEHMVALMDALQVMGLMPCKHVNLLPPGPETSLASSTCNETLSASSA